MRAEMADDGVTEQLDDNAALFWLNKQLAAAPTGGAAHKQAESFVDLADGQILLKLVRKPPARIWARARSVRSPGALP